MRRAHLGSSPFMHKERWAYFSASLILSKGRRALLMLVSIHPFPSLVVHTYMRAHLPLLDMRRSFKGLSQIFISYLSFLRSVYKCPAHM
jgi:hypothetical protein